MIKKCGGIGCETINRVPDEYCMACYINVLEAALEDILKAVELTVWLRGWRRGGSAMRKALIKADELLKGRNA